MHLLGTSVLQDVILNINPQYQNTGKKTQKCTLDSAGQTLFYWGQWSIYSLHVLDANT